MCFQHDVAYGDFKDLPRTTASDKVLGDKAFNIAKKPKYDGCQSGRVSMVCKFFDKMSCDGTVKRARPQTLATRDKSAIKSEIIFNQNLRDELLKPIIRKCEK